LSEANIIAPSHKNTHQLYSFVATSNADERIAPFGFVQGTLRQVQGKKTATLSFIKELKVELSVATMILIVQKAGIKKTLKIKTAKTSSLVGCFITVQPVGSQKPILPSSS
jgi:hypothetical protein